MNHLISSQMPYPIGHRSFEIKAPTLRLLKLRPYLDMKLESSDLKSDAYPLGHRVDGKSGRRMIKILINELSSCQRAESYTILPGLGK